MPQLPKRFTILFCAVFCTITIAIPLCLIILPKETFSAEENRVLASLPSFSAEALASGDYTDRLASYVRDHLPARALLLNTKAASELLLAKRENNHVIAASDSYLIKRFSYSDEALLAFRENAAAIQTLTEQLSAEGKPAVFLCAPRAIDVLTHRCPKSYSEPSERSVWQILASAAPDAITVTELLRERAENGERIWFRTDHHWTPLGAYYVYAALGESLGYTPLPRNAFSEETISNSFLGTSHASGRIPLIRPDTITAMRYYGDDDYTCTNVLTGQTTSGFYREEALSERDQYEYFLGANTAHLRIRENGTEARPTLLLIKDSYAQCLAPFLARHFNIEMIDLRYFRGDATETIRTILSDASYSGTLILCNADTLTASVGFDKILMENL